MTDVRLLPGILGSAADVGGKPSLTTDRNETGAIFYGPYEERAAGRYRVDFEVALADTTPPLGDPVCYILDVRANSGATLLVERYVLHSELAIEFGTFSVEFELQEPRTLEYRIVGSGQLPLRAIGLVALARLGESRKLAKPKTAQEQAWENEREFLDGYLRNVSGLIHVGANLGQERRYYWLIGLDVIWVEPIREIYEQLVDHTSSYPRQRAINALLTSRAGEQVEFRIANNNGASSSILPLEDHAVIFPDISYTENRIIVSTTLADLVRDEGISLDRYQALTLDVEGAEKMVLEGGLDLLGRFKYIKCEVADFPARTGTPTVDDLDRIMHAAGFAQLIRRSFAVGPSNSGTFWDIVWKRTESGQVLHDPSYKLPIVVNPLEVEGIEKCE